MAKLWPSCSSTVVLVRRVIRAGHVVPLTWRNGRVDLATSGSSSRLIKPVVEHDRREGQADAVFLVLDGGALVGADAGTAIGNSPPARNEAVSPDCATRFGSARRRARFLVSSALTTTSIGMPASRILEMRVPNGAVPDGRPLPPPTPMHDAVAAAGRVAALPADAEFAAGVALGLEEADLEHDLLGVGDADGVDDRLAAELRGDIERGAERDAVGDRAAEADAAVDQRRRRACVGQGRAQRPLQFADIERDFDIDHADQLLLAVIEEDVGAAVLLGEHVERVVGQRRDVDDVRIADHDVAEIDIGLDGDRLRRGHLQRDDVAGRGKRIWRSCASAAPATAMTPRSAAAPRRGNAAPERRRRRG